LETKPEVDGIIHHTNPHGIWAPWCMVVVDLLDVRLDDYDKGFKKTVVALNADFFSETSFD